MKTQTPPTGNLSNFFLLIGEISNNKFRNEAITKLNKIISNVGLKIGKEITRAVGNKKKEGK